MNPEISVIEYTGNLFFHTISVQFISSIASPSCKNIIIFSGVMAEVVGSRKLDIFKNSLYVVYILFLYILLDRNQSHSPNLPEGMLENAEE